MLKAIIRGTAACCALALGATAWGATTLQAPNGQIRMTVTPGGSPSEVVSIKVGSKWVPALSSPDAATRVVTLPSSGVPYATAAASPHGPKLAVGGFHKSDMLRACVVKTVSRVPDGLAIRGDCGGTGTFLQRVRLTHESGVLAVTVKFEIAPGAKINSVSDQWNFAPGRRAANSPEGPVDFVWSQNIKNEKDGDIPQWAFKAPVVMLQQGPVFTALMPTLQDRRSVPLALDLNVTSQKLPWLAYGAIPSTPYGHSYFRRSATGSPDIINAVTTVSGQVRGFVLYRYSIVASDQPYKLGYIRAVQLLWKNEGHKELMRSNNLQQNVLRPWLVTFNQWAQDAWVRYANQVYFSFRCGDRTCGTLASFRNPWGHWSDNPGPDAWFNPWFQTLRTAYGWYLYGQKTHNPEIGHKAESVLNLILTSPRDGGAFSTIYLFKTKKWQRSDGWAGYGNQYHAFGMSWTGYWMLKWGKNLTPDREAEILQFLKPYGDFLVKEQLVSGVIPSWYDTQLQPYKVFRDYNTETAASALFLASLYQATHDTAYLTAAEKAMDFITREALPRQKWFDFETFLSCARKPFNFYDKWTAQYPQNDLSQIQAADAYWKLYEITKQQKYLTVGTHVLDYLLLDQQVWNNPAFSPKVVGGFTVQNTDGEWSDAREAYAAMTLWHYYEVTGRGAYLQRTVAAARATFAVAPWENWAHTGYLNESGSLTGIHWGEGSGMTTVEMLEPTLGDAYINLKYKNGAGFNACSIQHLKIEGDRISFDLATFPAGRTITVRFAGVDPDARYQIVWNGNQSGWIAGSSLIRNGYVIRPNGS